MQPNDDKQTPVNNNDVPTQPTQPSAPELTTPEITEPARAETTVVQPTIVEPQVSAPAAGVATPVSANTLPPAPTAQPLQSEVPPNTAFAPIGDAPAAKSPKRKRTLLLATVAAVILLGGGGVGAYFGLILPNQPQKITQDGLINTLNSEKVTSGHFEGEVKLEGGEASKTVSSVSFEGAANNSNAFELKVGVNTAVTKIGFEAKTTDGKTFYARLSGLEGLDKLLAAYATSAQGVSNPESAKFAGDMLVSIYAPIIAQVNNNWYSVDESLLKQATSTLPSENTKLSPESAKQIGAIYKKNQFINIDKRLADEDIHGVSSYHIQATINKDKLASFITELKNANIKELEGLKLKDFEQKDLDELKKTDFSKYPFDIWITKKDRYITQIATTFKQDDTTYKVRFAIYDFNKTVNVEKPASSKSVLELLSELAPALGGNGVLGANTTSNPLGISL